MGMMIDGQWHSKEPVSSTQSHTFQRAQSAFRDWITADGGPGPDGQAAQPAQANRYHLYVSLACPWAHRTLIMRELKGLQKLISVSVVNPIMGDQGWTFEPAEGVVPDPVMDAQFLHQLYAKADPQFTGRITVPVLWDKQRGTIINNESAEIMRIFNSAFDTLGARSLDMAPAELLGEIDQINAHVYDTVNNGVYKAGFARSQAAYDTAVHALFDSLDGLEARLSQQRYLTGTQLTEADWRLFTTLIRFDPVYVGHFKCNLRRLIDYPNLWNYMLELYQMPGVASTVSLDHIKTHYYSSHRHLNPTGIVPAGPVLDLNGPHGRGHLPVQPGPLHIGLQ
ncbi:glutathione S-transferase family protein [Alcaligenes sp. PF14]|uniref:glutathione S-transferase family protein n=1 Tax=Alcaligenes sp. PF14 TaxID=3120297 RepID=UPI00301A7590